MKKWILGLVCLVSSVAFADYRLIIPQSPGGGTSVWGGIVARQLEKHLGEKIVLEHIPGANDIPGFNKFHNELQSNPKVIMLAHGGNAESFLVHLVDYDYKDYIPIGLQNMSIVVGHRINADPFDGVKFGYASGSNPDAMIMTMMICGPNKSIKEYAQCYKEKFKFVRGMKGNDIRLAYMRGELNTVRDTPAAYIKYHATADYSKLWFSEGMLDIKSGKVIPSPGMEDIFVNTIFKRRWGVEPSGDLYNSYLLVKNYRDVLQKSLWVGKNNPNADRLRTAMQKMINDPESIAVLNRDIGEYPWVIGNDVSAAMTKLEKLITTKTLKDLVYWNSVVFEQQAFFKDNIASKITTK